jgi:hypothetical protein
MISLQYINILDTDIPNRYSILLSDNYYDLYIQYNARADFYTGILIDIDTNDVIYTGRFLYSNLFIQGTNTYITEITDNLFPYNFQDVYTSTLSVTDFNEDTINNPVNIYFLTDGVITEE